MTKILNVLLISILLALAACGSSQNEIDSKEKAKQDSIANASIAPKDFNAFLQEFITSVNENKNQENYIHKDIGIYVYTNPGAFCSATKSNKIASLDAIKEISLNNIYNRNPKGDFCEGYPGEKDGFYYFETANDELPSFYDAASNGDKKVVLPANLNYQKFIKVNVIVGESFKVDLYFTCIDSTWYLIGQSFCDCSA